MKPVFYAFLLLLLIPACSKDNEKKDNPIEDEIEMWTTDQTYRGIIINSTEAYFVGEEYIAPNTGWAIALSWLKYGEIKSLKDIDIFNIPAISGINVDRIPIKENYGYVQRLWRGPDSSSYNKYFAFYILEIHRDLNNNILYIKYIRREFIPYKGWK